MTATTACRTTHQVLSLDLTIGGTTYTVCVDEVTFGDDPRARFHATAWDGEDCIWITSTLTDDPAFAAQAACGAAIDDWYERQLPNV